MCTPPATLCTPHATLSRWAELLAVKFNEQAEELGLVGLPKISYLTCCYVKTTGSDRPAAEEVKERYLFAERKIEGDFRKWNTNFGAVIRLSDDALQELRERERDEARSGDGDNDGDGDSNAPARTRVSLVTDDVPQAFSHFSLFYSERPLSQVKGKGGVAGRCLACDLQGCFQRDQNTFTLFDPVIHSDLGEKSLESSPRPGPKLSPRPDSTAPAPDPDPDPAQDPNPDPDPDPTDFPNANQEKRASSVPPTEAPRGSPSSSARTGQ